MEDSFNEEFFEKDAALEESFSDHFTKGKIKDVGIINAKIRQRAGKRQSLTKIIAAFKNLSDNLSERDIRFFLSKFDNLHSCLTELDSEIETFMLGANLWSSAEYIEHTSHSEDYFDQLSSAQISLNMNLSRINSESSGNNAPVNASNNAQAIILR